MSDYDFDEWLDIAEGRQPQPSDLYIVICFPDEEIRDAYLATAGERTAKGVRSILRRFLGGSRTIELLDEMHLQSLVARQQSLADSSTDAPPTLTEYDRRVIAHFRASSETPTWEGLTWVIDLLPHSPQQAMDAIHAYLAAHAQVLADLRITGLGDAADLIRARYITRGSTAIEVLQEVLLGLSARDFEYLVARLYRGMGYDVIVTPAQKDGGKDVIASRQHETLYIECKNWRGRVDAPVVAGLVGRVETHRVTRGIVVGTSGFTEGHASASAVADESPARISLMDGPEMITRLNEILGSEWHRRLEFLLQQERAAQSFS